jgi:DNA polymerase III psi subunit
VSINQRQFARLQEMGISLWKSRQSVNLSELSDQDSSSTIDAEQRAKANTNLDKKSTDASLKSDNSHTHISLEAIHTSAFFHNVLKVIDISVGEVTEENNHLNMGLFNWHFKAYDDVQKALLNDNVMSYQNNSLVTPSIEQIKSSPALKKALWLTISKNIL